MIYKILAHNSGTTRLHKKGLTRDEGMKELHRLKGYVYNLINPTCIENQDAIYELVAEDAPETSAASE